MGVRRHHTYMLPEAWTPTNGTAVLKNINETFSRHGASWRRMLLT